MQVLPSSHPRAMSVPVVSPGKLTSTCSRSSRRKAGKFAPFLNAAADGHHHCTPAVNQQHTSPATDPSRRSALQQLVLATAALSLGTGANLATPEASQSALVQFPVADLRNEYYLVCTVEPDLDAGLPLRHCSPSTPLDCVRLKLCTAGKGWGGTV